MLKHVLNGSFKKKSVLLQHQYMGSVHEKLNESKQDGKKQKKTRKKAGSSSTTVAMETDEESNM